MHKKTLIALIICTGLAIFTWLADELYWLGENNFLLMNALLVMHLSISILALWFMRANKIFKITVIILLFVGQWWAVKFLTMIALWKINGFAP